MKNKISGVFVLGLFFMVFLLDVGFAQNTHYGPRFGYGHGMRGNSSYPCMGCTTMDRWQRNVSVEEFKGTVSSVSFPISEINTGSEVLYIRLGPWWYWQRQGYKLSVGEKVKITGYRCGSYVIPLKISTTFQEIILRDQRGFPMWIGGRGRWYKGK